MFLFSPVFVLYLQCLVVLGSLAGITYDQELYDESLQMYGKSKDILMRTDPVSEDLAQGRLLYVYY